MTDEIEETVTVSEVKTNIPDHESIKIITFSVDITEALMAAAQVLPAVAENIRAALHKKADEFIEMALKRTYTP